MKSPCFMNINPCRIIILPLALCSVCVLSSCQQGLNQLAKVAQSGDVVDEYKYAYRLLSKGKQGDAYRQSALQWFLASAHKGYAPAQVAAAACYQFGLAGPSDLYLAEYWYKKAAKQGNVNAFKGLLSLALSQDDLKEAAPWLEKLALQGDESLQMVYASMLAEGAGVKANPRKAVDFWRYAAISGNGEACLMMGICYSQGWGVPPNMRLAKAWWRMSSDAGNGAAKKLLREYR